MKIQKNVNGLNVRLIFLIAMLLVLLSIISCENENTKTKISKIPFKIDVLKFGEHKLINLVVDGFEDRLKYLFEEDIQIRIADGKFDPATVTDLSSRIVASDSDIAVSVTTPATALMIGANRGTKKQVFTFVSDLKAINYKGKGSLRNVCGISDTVNYKKTLELIRKLMPTSKNIGMVITRNESNALLILNGFKKYSKGYNFDIIPAEIAQISDLQMAIKILAAKVDLFLFGGDNSLAEVITNIVELCRIHNKPLFACDQISIQEGAVAGYSVDYYKMGQATADYCAFLKAGANTEALDVQRIVASNLIINLKAIKYYNLEIDRQIANEAFEVIR